MVWHLQMAEMLSKCSVFVACCVDGQHCKGDFFVMNQLRTFEIIENEGPWHNTTSMATKEGILDIVDVIVTEGLCSDNAKKSFE